MRAVFCESHDVWELLIESESDRFHVKTLNELDAGPHHLMPSDRGFIHSGEAEGCKLCRQWLQVGNMNYARDTFLKERPTG